MLTERSLNQSFRISYGSGQASGTLGQDLVTMGGYSVASQTFAYCNTITSGLISSSVSGIMGLSWQSLAYSGGMLRRAGSYLADHSYSMVAHLGPV